MMIQSIHAQRFTSSDTLILLVGTLPLRDMSRLW